MTREVPIATRVVEWAYKSPLTRAEFNLRPIDLVLACPDCGRSDTEPAPGCACKADTAKKPPLFLAKGYHIYRHHHRCALVTSRRAVAK